MTEKRWSAPEFQGRLAAFLEEKTGRRASFENIRRFSVGLSWITFGFTARLSDGDGNDHSLDLILRIGDPGGLLAPYRAAPEFLALTALSDRPGLPLPRAHWHSDDERIIGAPFIITQRVEGETPMPWKGKSGDDGTRRHDASLGEDFVDALAAIHTFAWKDSPAAALADGTGADEIARRETQRWAAHAALPRADVYPQMHYAWRWLQANAAPAQRVTIVHGDYRVGNFLALKGRISAILDWELVHLGDPHEDLAWAGLRVFAAGTARVGGLIERDDFYARYEEKTGFAVRPELLRYYEILGLFKQASMLVGAVDRIASGRARDYRMAAMGFQLVPTLLELGRLIEAAS